MVFTLAAAIVVGAVVSLITGSWWFLALALAIHFVATFLVMFAIGARLREQDKPDPVTEARLAEESAEERAEARHRSQAPA